MARPARGSRRFACGVAGWKITILKATQMHLVSRQASENWEAAAQI